MTVSSETVRKAHAGNGTTVAFSTDFVFESNSHVSVFLVTDSDGSFDTWVEGTQYTLTGAGTDSAGTLTVDTSPVDYTPLSGETLVIIRDVPYTQETDFPTGGSFPSDSVETALDLAAMRSAKVAFDLSRAIHAPTADPSDIDMELPIYQDREDGYLRFSADGKSLTVVTSVAPATATVTAFAETVLDDTSASAMRATLGLGTAATATTGTSGTTVPLNDGNITRSGTLTQSAATTVNATLTASQQIVLSGDISPSQITADQNNYNPTGLSTASGLRLTADALRTITGLAGGSDGRVITLENVGSFSIVLSDADVSSDAANRFDLSGDLGVVADTGVILRYDGTDSVWRCVGAYHSAANATDMETATSARVYSSPALQQRHPGHPKVRAHTSVAAGVPTLEESYNMTSITDTAAGQLTHTIATDFSTALWTPTVSVERASTALTIANIANVEILQGGIAAGTLLAECWDDTATTHVAEDPDSWQLVGLGDQ